MKLAVSDYGCLEHIKVNQRVIRNIMGMKGKFGSCANMGIEEDRGELEESCG